MLNPQAVLFFIIKTDTNLAVSFDFLGHFGGIWHKLNAMISNGCVQCSAIKELQNCMQFESCLVDSFLFTVYLSVPMTCG